MNKVACLVVSGSGIAINLPVWIFAVAGNSGDLMNL